METLNEMSNLFPEKALENIVRDPLLIQLLRTLSVMAPGQRDPDMGVSAFLGYRKPKCSRVFSITIGINNRLRTWMGWAPK